MTALALTLIYVLVKNSKHLREAKQYAKITLKGVQLESSQGLN
jgi:hypothetical protein